MELKNKKEVKEAFLSSKITLNTAIATLLFLGYDANLVTKMVLSWKKE